jgi:hypothetical protein
MSEPGVQAEQMFVENSFGTITSKRVIYYRGKGWFSGGSREDIPLQHVTSVRFDISRSIISAIVFLLIGLGLIASGDVVAILIGIFFTIFAVVLMWGSPSVVVNTSGVDLNAAKGLPWQRGEANAFVESLHKQLFKS